MEGSDAVSPVRSDAESSVANQPDATITARPDGYAGHAVFASKRGGPDVLEVREIQLPPPGAGEVIVQVLAAGVAFGDQQLREGFQPARQPPVIPGYDVTGAVVAVGSGVTEPTVGANVAAWTGGTGGYATYVTVPAWAALEYPDDLGAELVASLILNYLTAYQLLARVAPVAEGATALIHPAGGSLGSALIQLGALRGLRMFGTASASRAESVRRMGAEPIDYRTEDYARRVRAEMPDGIDAIYDGIGGTSWRKGLALLRPGGHLAVYGVTEGFTKGRRDIRRMVGSVISAPRTSYLTYVQKSVGVTGFRIDAALAAHHDWFREDLGILIGMLRDGRITPTIHRVFPFSEAADAHRELGSGRAGGGKILLTPG